MMTAGLSLEQAPPFNVPLRFFLTAPPFLLLASGLLLWQGPDLFASRWLPATLALASVDVYLAHGYPFTQSTCFNVCTTSTKSCCAAITASMSL